MELKVNDIIETLVGGPYKIISITDGLITFKMKNGIGMTILSHITNVNGKLIVNT